MSRLLLITVYLTGFMIMKPYLTKKTKFDVVLWFNMIMLWLIAFIEQFMEISRCATIVILAIATLFAVIYTAFVKTYKTVDDVDTGVSVLFNTVGTVTKVDGNGLYTGKVALESYPPFEVKITSEDELSEGDEFVIYNYNHNINMYIVRKK